MKFITFLLLAVGLSLAAMELPANADDMTSEVIKAPCSEAPDVGPTETISELDPTTVEAAIIARLDDIDQTVPVETPGAMNERRQHRSDAVPATAPRLDEATSTLNYYDAARARSLRSGRFSGATSCVSLVHDGSRGGSSDRSEGSSALMLPSLQ